MKKESLLEKMASFTRLIARELFALMKEGGLTLVPGSIGSSIATTNR
jgi:hypothetical protein